MLSCQVSAPFDLDSVGVRSINCKIKPMALLLGSTSLCSLKPWKCRKAQHLRVQTVQHLWHACVRSVDCFHGARLYTTSPYNGSVQPTSATKTVHYLIAIVNENLMLHVDSCLPFMCIVAAVWRALPLCMLASVMCAALCKNCGCGSAGTDQHGLSHFTGRGKSQKDFVPYQTAHQTDVGAPMAPATIFDQCKQCSGRTCDVQAASGIHVR